MKRTEPVLGRFSPSYFTAILTAPKLAPFTGPNFGAVQFALVKKNKNNPFLVRYGKRQKYWFGTLHVLNRATIKRYDDGRARG